MTAKVIKTGLAALPLGGVGECGSLNLMVYECDGEMIIVDAGMGFPQPFTPGIDSIIPDITYIRDNIKKLKGIFITHAHEDHIGALHYLWPDMPVDVYATKFSRLILEEKFESVGLAREVKIHEVKTGQKIKVGNKFEVEYVGVNHSIPEANGLMVRTSYGNIFHTGDYKFDASCKLGNEHVSLDRLKEIGDEGVLALFGDSTSVANEGSSGEEGDVFEGLVNLVAGAKKRIYLCTISSQVARMHSAMRAAIQHGRKIAIYGRSKEKRIQNAIDCGFIAKDIKDHIIDIREAAKMSPEKVMIFVTGAQAQSRAALTRMSRGDTMHLLPLDAGDEVILTSLWIPGNEREIGRMVSGLEKQNIKVHHVHNTKNIYASGHPYKEDVVKMYELIRPQIVIPVHGDFQQMRVNSEVAKECGVPQQFVIEDGKKIVLGPEAPYVEDESYPYGWNFVDGLNILDEDRFIIKERMRMSESGIATVTLIIDGQSKEIMGTPTVKTKGLIDEILQEDLLRLVEDEALSAVLTKFPDSHISDESLAEEMMRQSVRRTFDRERGRKPLTIPQVLEA